MPSSVVLLGSDKQPISLVWFQSHLVNTIQDTFIALITQEIPRILGVKCQQQGQRTNIYIYYKSLHHQSLEEKCPHYSSHINKTKTIIISKLMLLKSDLIPLPNGSKKLKSRKRKWPPNVKCWFNGNSEEEKSVPNHLICTLEPLKIKFLKSLKYKSLQKYLGVP